MMRRPLMHAIVWTGLSLAWLAAIGWGSSSAQAQVQRRLGPVYPGETILSERIVIPPSPVPVIAATVTTVTTPEPLSASDGQPPKTGVLGEGTAGEAKTVGADRSVFALGERVWSRLLDLERENANLAAELEFERRLQMHRESMLNSERELRDLLREKDQRLAEMMSKFRRESEDWSDEKRKLSDDINAMAGLINEAQSQRQQVENNVAALASKNASMENLNEALKNQLVSMTQELTRTRERVQRLSQEAFQNVNALQQQANKEREQAQKEFEQAARNRERATRQSSPNAATSKPLTEPAKKVESKAESKTDESKKSDAKRDEKRSDKKERESSSNKSRHSGGKPDARDGAMATGADIDPQSPLGGVQILMHTAVAE